MLSEERWKKDEKRKERRRCDGSHLQIAALKLLLIPRFIWA